MTKADPTMVTDDMVTDDMVTDGEDLVAADGRRPGRRGRATRQRLLERTADLLATTAYRDLKVVDVARGAGTSPATFYQYFADVEGAILVLGEGIIADATDLAGHVAGDWGGRPVEMAGAIVDEFLTFWDDHASVLRVIDLLTLEGDGRFRDLRTRALNAITDAFQTVLVDGRRSGRLDASVDPQATAGVIVAMLAHVASHRPGMEAWGVSRSALVASLTRLVSLAVSGVAPSRR
ncbi:MAG TPA: TetR family transcriptional regulator [Acidimicrobiales bacterium]